MNKYYNPRLLNTVVTGSGMQHPRRPHVILGKYPGEYVLGDLMDANAIQELTSDKQATYSINTDYDENSDYTNAIAETLSTEEITPKIGDIMVVNPIKNDIIYEDLLENYKVTKVTANTNETLNIDAFPETVGIMLVTTYGSTLNAHLIGFPSIDTYNIDVSINNEVNTVISDNFGWTDDALTYLNNLFLNLTILTINHSYDNLCDPLFIFDVETDPISYQYTKDGWEKTSKDVIYVETTWSELKTLKDNLLLQPGYDYRITDYQCTTTQENTKSAGHQFDIIVTALTNNTLSKKASAILHEEDTYFTNCDLSAWQIWYDIKNDTSKYAWADTTNGKGVIYRMIDEFNNDVPYDFKNILFVPYSSDNSITYYAYTFNSTNADGGIDLSLTGSYSRIHDNVIKPNSSSINFICFLGTYCLNNTFNNFCNNNTLGNGFSNNTFGNNCLKNIFGNNCYYNIFENECKNNIFGGFCTNNIFMNFFQSNTFGNACDSNIFKSSCNGNTFGNTCLKNTFGNGCSYNTFGKECLDNTFGDICCYNTFLDSCIRNTFGDYCKGNKLTINYILDSEFNCSNITLTSSTGSTTEKTPIKNLLIKRGVTGILSVPLNTDYLLNIAKDRSGNIVQYCEDDIPVNKGLTTARPSSNLIAGYQYFDTTLNKPIWYNGTAWVDSTGTAV